MGGKWLSLLKEIAPGIKRAAFVFNPDNAPGGRKYFLASFEAAAGSLGIELVTVACCRAHKLKTSRRVGCTSHCPCRQKHRTES
jgi:hypothetical protein